MMSAIHSGQLSPPAGFRCTIFRQRRLFPFLLVTFRILQRWIIEFKVARGEDVYDPAHPERNTPESLSMQMQICWKRNPMKSNLIEANTPSGKEEH